MLRCLALGALLGASLSAVAALSWPADSAAFTTTGDHLDLTQRDVRVVNSFTGPAANDNTVPQAEFPGTLGAPLAIRKAHAEWSSGPWAGTGIGDGSPTNVVLGSGNANFDNTWQGVAAAGGTNDNVHVALPGSHGSTLSFVETPASDGWRVIYYEGVVAWSDGPGAPDAGQLDLQGDATHEIGHVVGLGHSSVAGATMFASLGGNGVAARSIEADDVAGLQSIYGVKSATKPVISALTGSLDVGGVLQIAGLHFAAAGNQAWFTAAASDGEPVKVTGLLATAGGTHVELTIPPGVSDGEVLVRSSAVNSGAVLSNAYPLDLAEGFTEIHPGFAPAGQPPVLTGLGDASPGGAGLILALSGATPAATGLLFVALAQGAVPFKGGTLYATPLVLALPVAVDAAGALAVSATLPADTPAGAVIVLQVGLAGAGGVQLSNGLRLDVP
jgi:hypothetical protein